MPADFSTFFTSSFSDGRIPYDYQKRLAEAPCESRLISVPTGLGKTASVILAWLWNRVHCQSPQWPRRLVFCLPMRTLVEQTYAEAEKWLQAHGLLWDGRSDHQGKVGLHLLMGGDESPNNLKDWDLYPDENAILIGTQDMLISRTLCRGYGMSRYRWPMHFALLNQDSLWIMDETQLMGVAVETSAQLDGFRHLPQWHRYAPCPTWWMSATLEDSRLATVDHLPPEGGWPRLSLQQPDRIAAKHRLEAVKQLHRADLTLSKQVKAEHYARDLAKLILEKHIPGQLTLVIVNQVQRAQLIFQALKKEGSPATLALVHSRFRKQDRQAHQDILINGTGDRIVVATQAVEAGVDVSARVLFTELAPWSSLVQRFGRCNRGGEFNAPGSSIHWIDLLFEKEAEAAPYTLAELHDARVELNKLDGQSLSPAALEAVQVQPRQIVRPVIRRRDFIDLFDTTPDIAGLDMDISRYVREGDDTDVQVYWRDLSASEYTPTKGIKEPAQQELCRVAVWRFQAFIDKLHKQKDDRNAYVWDGLKEDWLKATKARPGAVYLLDSRAGGYSAELGWTGEIASIKKQTEWTPELPVEGDASPDAVSVDPLSLTGTPLTLAAHTSHVVTELKAILANVSLAEAHQHALSTAALWHDVGKSHAVFQKLLRDTAGPSAPEGILAKSGKGRGRMPAERKYFRHELASALAWLAHHDGESETNLTAYIIAAHHGKVRLSIRSLPEETPPPDELDRLMARGILDGDSLPELHLPDLVHVPATTLSLDLMRMGQDEQGRPSWLARMITLRDQLGPFTLAYLETLLRAADMRASAAEASTPHLS